MTEKHVIAVDLGAGSGRVMDVAFDGARLALNELYRFTSKPVKASGTLYWDALGIWREVQHGLKLRPADTAAIGVDTWGVDFALLDKNGQLLSNPVYYREPARAEAYKWLLDRMDKRAIFERTGIQFMPINSLYQLAAYLHEESPLLGAADSFLTMPDLFHYWLTGEKAAEFTNATTTQMFNPIADDWDRETLTEAGIPTHFLPRIVRAGDQIGAYENIPVIVPPTHDTGSAVVAVPTTTRDYAYLSSGTWSLLGLEVPRAVINDDTYTANITNEGGYNNTIRLLKNIMGLWVIEQTLATWREAGRDYSYDECQQMVQASDNLFRTFVDPDDDRFLPPGDMPARVRDYCAANNQPSPETDAQVLTALHVSLSMKYRYVMDLLQGITGQPIHQLHIIGGGSKNRTLNQLTANAIGRPVYAGPAEATALGNAIVQLITLGEIDGLAQSREMLSETVGVEVYEPQDEATWKAEYQRYRTLLKNESLL